jgi:hypothetical protein
VAGLENVRKQNKLEARKHLKMATSLRYPGRALLGRRLPTIKLISKTILTYGIKIVIGVIAGDIDPIGKVLIGV